MAYSTQTDLEIAAGGRDKLVRLTDHRSTGTVDTRVLARAIGEADAWIDGYARRLYGKRLPFGDAADAENPVPNVIRDIAAAEAVYRLKSYASDVSAADLALREDRQRVMRDLEAGTLLPLPADPYPVGTAAGPRNVVRSDEPDGYDADVGTGRYTTRRSTRGLW